MENMEQTAGAGMLPLEGQAAFEELLTKHRCQGEFDRRVSKALDTARTKWEAEARQREESDRKSATEREAQAAAERERLTAMEAREKALTKQELAQAAKAYLKEAGLPEGFAELLSDADEKAMREGAEKVESLFREAVQAAIEKRLRGKTPRMARAVSQDAMIRAAMGL